MTHPSLASSPGRSRRFDKEYGHCGVAAVWVVTRVATAGKLAGASEAIRAAPMPPQGRRLRRFEDIVGALVSGVSAQCSSRATAKAATTAAAR